MHTAATQTPLSRPRRIGFTPRNQQNERISTRVSSSSSPAAGAGVIMPATVLPARGLRRTAEHSRSVVPPAGTPTTRPAPRTMQRSSTSKRHLCDIASEDHDAKERVDHVESEKKKKKSSSPTVAVPSQHDNQNQTNSTSKPTTAPSKKRTQNKATNRRPPRPRFSGLGVGGLSFFCKAVTNNVNIHTMKTFMATTADLRLVSASSMDCKYVWVWKDGTCDAAFGFYNESVLHEQEKRFHFCYAQRAFLMRYEHQKARAESLALGQPSQTLWVMQNLHDKLLHSSYDKLGLAVRIQQTTKVPDFRALCMIFPGKNLKEVASHRSNKNKTSRTTIFWLIHLNPPRAVLGILN